METEDCEVLKTDNATIETQEYNGFYDNAYNASAKVNLMSYFNAYSSLLNTSKDVTINIKDYMGCNISDSELKILSEYCSADNLTVPGEMEKRTMHRVTWRKEIFETEDIPTDIDLETVKASKQRTNIKKEIKILKYRSETPIHYELEEDTCGPSAVPRKDLLVYVRVYIPFCSSTSRMLKKFGKISVDSVIAILGSQTLADLRDKITCLSDFSISKDVSDDLSNAVGPPAKDVYRSGFFYIEGTFYNDNRDPTNIDYSEVIREWSETHDYGPFKIDSMETTRIDSLSLKFGFPWVYQHQGRCEHIIVFSDARLFNHDDELSLSVYPRISRIKQQANRYCMTCGIYSARWITIDNDRLPHNPCFFCDSCFKSYNYVDGQKVGNFKAYIYPYDKKLLCLENDT